MNASSSTRVRSSPGTDSESKCKVNLNFILPIFEILSSNYSKLTVNLLRPTIDDNAFRIAKLQRSTGKQSKQ